MIRVPYGMVLHGRRPGHSGFVSWLNLTLTEDDITTVYFAWED